MGSERSEIGVELGAKIVFFGLEEKFVYGVVLCLYLSYTNLIYEPSTEEPEKTVRVFLFCTSGVSCQMTTRLFISRRCVKYSSQIL